MNIAIVCSSEQHPVFSYLTQWKEENTDSFNVALVKSVSELPASGDILFLVSCSEIVTSKTKNNFRYTLVLHASDLPNGRGWSPHVWEILTGKNELTLSLINAEDKVDTGDIWAQRVIKLNGTELYDEINELLFCAEVELIDWACNHITEAVSVPQTQSAGSYYRKRTPADSKIDADKSISEQFNLLRVCDPNRFPAFFEINGNKYKLIVEKFDEE